MPSYPSKRSKRRNRWRDRLSHQDQYRISMFTRPTPPADRYSVLVLAPSHQDYMQWWEYNASRFLPAPIHPLQWVEQLIGCSPENTRLIRLENWEYSPLFGDEGSIEYLNLRFPGWQNSPIEPIPGSTPATPQATHVANLQYWTPELYHPQFSQQSLESFNVYTTQFQISARGDRIRVTEGDRTAEFCCYNFTLTQNAVERQQHRARVTLQISLLRDWRTRQDSIEINGICIYPQEWRFEHSPNDLARIEMTLPAIGVSIDTEEGSAHITFQTLGQSHLVGGIIADCNRRIDRDDVIDAIGRFASRQHLQHSYGAKLYRPSACEACLNYHGKSYSGNMLICAMHPYGWQNDDNCPDKETQNAID